ncbi:MAG: LysE family translocator [Actinobacteria bacterium]|nr:LysE family translocator [Actinomycetota bacterium]
MPSLDLALTFLLTTLVLVAIPGPNTLFIVGQGIAGGRPAAVRAALGVEIGSLIHILAASLGLSALLARSAAAYEMLRWVGAAYLVWLAIGAFRAARSDAGSTATMPSAMPMPMPTASGNPLLRGVMVNVLNPKVALFFLAFFPQFLDKSKAVLPQSLVFGAILLLVGVTLDLMYGIGASAMGGRITSMRRTHMASGIIYLVLAIVSVVTGRRPATA